MSDYERGRIDGANAAYRSILVLAFKWIMVTLVIMGTLDSVAYLIGKLNGA